MFFCFFFKQKTAYEMRISDWSSDVCSSDLDLGKGLGFWNTMPTRARSCTTSIDEAYISSASSVISPSTRALATVSFMRFKVRRKVDLPQPDGPMKAVTFSIRTSMETLLIACFWPYTTLTSRAVILGFCTAGEPE